MLLVAVLASYSPVAPEKLRVMEKSLSPQLKWELQLQPTAGL